MKKLESILKNIIVTATLTGSLIIGCDNREIILDISENCSPIQNQYKWGIPESEIANLKPLNLILKDKNGNAKISFKVDETIYLDIEGYDVECNKDKNITGKEIWCNCKGLAYSDALCDYDLNSWGGMGLQANFCIGRNLYCKDKNRLNIIDIEEYGIHNIKLICEKNIGRHWSNNPPEKTLIGKAETIVLIKY